MGRIKSFVFVVLSFASVSYAVDAFYRHHQRTVTTSLESDLVNREIGIDGSARNSLIAKKADGNLIHIISKEMDTASLNGVLNVAGQTNLSGAVKMANYTSGRVPYFSTGGLITDASTLTYNGTTLAVNSGTYSGTLGVTGNFSVNGGTAAFLVDAASRKAAVKSSAVGAEDFYVGGTTNFTGNSTVGGTLGVTGAVSLASSLTFAAGQDILIADNSGAGLTITQSGNPYLRFVTTDAAEKVSVFKAVEAQSTLAVTGIQSNSEALAFAANGTAGAGRVYKSAGSGLTMRGVTGSSNDFGIESASGSNILINPTGTTSVTFPGTSVTISGTATTTGVHTFTAAPVFTAATASRLYATNGSKAGTSNAALTINGFTYPDGAGSLASTSAATNGQLLVGSTSSAPVAATLTGTANEITVTNGAGSITLDIPNSPVFTTPNIGAATATSVAASGAVSGVSLATTGGETFTYGDTSFTITVSTGMTTTPTGTAIGTKIGKVVTLFIPHISGTSNSTQFIISGIPPTWTPATVQHVPYMGGTDNGVPQFTGIAYVMTDNTILLGTAAGGFAGWTNSGTKATGFSSQGTTLTYLVL